MIITLLTRDRLSFTKSTLSTFLGHNPGARDHTWVALDGASTDGTVDYLKEKGLFTKIVAQDKNTGLHPGMKELFETALEVGEGEEYMLHLENDWWSTETSALNTCESILDEREEVGIVQLREIEDENFQVKTWNPEYWDAELGRIINLGKLHQGMFPIRYYEEFTKDNHQYLTTDWHWVNQPSVMRREIAEHIFDDTDMERKGSIEFQLMKTYAGMGHKTVRSKPGSMITSGFLYVGDKVARTPGTMYK